MQTAPLMLVKKLKVTNQNKSNGNSNKTAEETTILTVRVQCQISHSSLVAKTRMELKTSRILVWDKPANL